MRSASRGAVVGACSAALAGAVLLCTVAGAKADTRATASGVESPATPSQTLSNFRGLSRWAYPRAPGAVHRDPFSRSRVVGRLQLVTRDGQAQLYLTLRSVTIDQVVWILLSIPGRPNGMTGWVPASDLSDLHVTHDYLRINRETLRAQLYRDGKTIWGAPVGVGRSIFPTPAGHYYVTEKLIPLEEPFYGPYALATSAYAPTLSDWPGGGVVGIHGTDEPQLIPGRPSHGCIRLRNGDVSKLWHLIEVGTPIEVV
jgi:L,D-transpeptidase catalytic domain